MILEPVVVDPRVKSWKDVLRNLIFHANDDGLAWPNAETIRAEVGYKSRRAVVDALAGLEGCGLLVKDRHRQGCGTRFMYRLNVTPESVVRLELDPSEDVDPGDVDNLAGMLITQGAESSKCEVTSPKCEVTSPKCEVTSHRSNKEISKNIIMNLYPPKCEVTSRGVDNSPEELPGPHGAGVPEVAASPRNDGSGGGPPHLPPAVSAESLVQPGPSGPADYLACCEDPGWRPNDPVRAPDLASAKRAVLACAMKAGLSRAMADRFWSKNAVRRWTGIDRGNTVAELAAAAAANWQRDDPKSYWAEVHRRRKAAASRTVT